MALSKEKQGEILLYKPKGRQTEIQVNLKEQTVWLNLNQIAELFGRDKSFISRHLRNIFKTRKLKRSRVVAKNATTAADGTAGFKRETGFFSGHQRSPSVEDSRADAKHGCSLFDGNLKILAHSHA